MKELLRTTIKIMAANKLISHVKKAKFVCSLLMSVSETVLLHCGNRSQFSHDHLSAALVAGFTRRSLQTVTFVQLRQYNPRNLTPAKILCHTVYFFLKSGPATPPARCLVFLLKR